jgi:hypothetical protein
MRNMKIGRVRVTWRGMNGGSLFRFVSLRPQLYIWWGDLGWEQMWVTVLRKLSIR